MVRIIGSVGEAVFLDVKGAVWRLQLGQDVAAERTDIDGYNPDSLPGSTCAIMLRSDGRLGIGAIDGLGDPENWFCNSDVAIYCDEWSGEGRVYGRSGELISIFDIKEWFSEVPFTFGLYAQSGSFSFDGYAWHFMYQDFEFSQKLYVAVFNPREPLSTRATELMTVDEAVWSFRSLPGSMGRMTPVGGFDFTFPEVQIGIPLFVIESSGAQIPTRDISGFKIDIRSVRGFSCCQSDRFFFASDHQESIYVFDLNLKLMKRFDLGVEALMVLLEMTILAVTTDAILRFDGVDFIEMQKLT